MVRICEDSPIWISRHALWQRATCSLVIIRRYISFPCTSSSKKHRNFYTSLDLRWPQFTPFVCMHSNGLFLVHPGWHESKNSREQGVLAGASGACRAKSCFDFFFLSSFYHLQLSLRNRKFLLSKVTLCINRWKSLFCWYRVHPSTWNYFSDLGRRNTTVE